MLIDVDKYVDRFGKVGMGKRITPKALEKAIEGSHGIVSNVARKLGCSWTTADNYIKNSPEAKKQIEAEKENILDLAEDGLFSQVKDKEAWALKYLLSTKGKTRGYTEKQELDVTHKGLDEYQDMISKLRGENDGEES